MGGGDGGGGVRRTRPSQTQGGVEHLQLNQSAAMRCNEGVTGGYVGKRKRGWGVTRGKKGRRMSGQWGGLASAASIPKVSEG